MISIIIPTYNEEKYLPSLLDCLKNQSFSKFEIIIADAFSTDSTRKIAERYKARVVDGGIPSIGRNSGAAFAKSDLLVFMDADISFDNTFLEKVRSDFKKNNYDFAIPYLKLNIQS